MITARFPGWVCCGNVSHTPADDVTPESFTVDDVGVMTEVAHSAFYPAPFTGGVYFAAPEDLLDDATELRGKAEQALIEAYKERA